MIDKIVVKNTRRDGSVYYTVHDYFIDAHYLIDETKHNSFVDAVLYERKKLMNQTANSKIIFGDPNNA